MGMLKLEREKQIKRKRYYRHKVHFYIFLWKHFSLYSFWTWMSNFKSIFCTYVCIIVCVRRSFCMGVICHRRPKWSLIVRLFISLRVFSNDSLITAFYCSGCLLIVGKLGYWSTISVAVTNLNLIMVRDISVCMPIDLEVGAITAFRKDWVSTHVPDTTLLLFHLNVQHMRVCVNQNQRGKRLLEGFKYANIHYLKTS